MLENVLLMIGLCGLTCGFVLLLHSFFGNSDDGDGWA